VARTLYGQELLAVDGVPISIEFFDKQALFQDDDGESFHDIVGREAAISILWPGERSWDQVLDSAQFDAAVALIAADWQTSHIEPVNAGDREPPDLRPVTHRSAMPGSCVDVIFVRTDDLP
jgi:hypothetical protein